MLSTGVGYSISMESDRDKLNSSLKKSLKVQYKTLIFPLCQRDALMYFSQQSICSIKRFSLTKSHILINQPRVN